MQDPCSWTTFLTYHAEIINLEEPFRLGHEVVVSLLDQNLRKLQAVIPSHFLDGDVISRNASLVKTRNLKMIRETHDTVEMLVRLGAAVGTHWKSAVEAVHILRGLVRREEPAIPNQLFYFMEQTTADNSTMRYVCRIEVSFQLLTANFPARTQGGNANAEIRQAARKQQKHRRLGG